MTATIHDLESHRARLMQQLEPLRAVSWNVVETDDGRLVLTIEERDYELTPAAAIVLGEVLAAAGLRLGRRRYP